MIELENVTFGYAGRPVLNKLSTRFEPGRFYGIFGPNGSGKSTLLKLITGELTPNSGRLAPTYATASERARTLAVVEQEIPARIPLSVREVVALGRYPWRKSTGNTAVVEDAVRRLQLTELSSQPYSNLSGGERQRVMLARAVAQATPFLLLDEPASSLDIGFQRAFYRLLRQFAREGKCVLMVSHDLFIAPHYLDAALLLHQGRLIAAGTPGEVLAAERLTTVFDCTR